jgi:endonuclease YncB( thermonuclease family)
LRLRGIDTAEMYTQAGRRARDFVVQVLADAPVVVISTRRTDGYGRSLADVKYLESEHDPHVILAQGTYLNGQLLREKLATRYLG